MPKQGRRLGLAPTELQDSPEPTSIEVAKMMPVKSTVSESVKATATVGPTESEIATAAYQLWLDNGGFIGSDQENWFWAEAMLRNACHAAPTEAKIVVEMRWRGHWEVWEMEWSSPRWVWD
jgi:hypothetical protein